MRIARCAAFLALSMPTVATGTPGGTCTVASSASRPLTPWSHQSSPPHSAYDSVLARLAPGPEAAEIRETVRIQASGSVEGMRPLPDIPIAVITSMKSDETSRYVNGTARGHEVWRSLHDEWFRRSRNGIHTVTTRSGHGIQADEPGLVMQAIRFVLDRVQP